jgi:hypothetical protein
VKVDDLGELLIRAHVDPTCYHLFGGSDEGVCILPEGQTWKVCISERGQRLEEMSFDTEDDACVYFLKRILELRRR